MESIIDIHHLTKKSTPRPNRETLFSVIDRIGGHLFEQTHELEKGNYSDKYFAACIKVAFSNLQAMRRLSVEYINEGNAILRNLVETNIDYFWLANILSNDSEKGERIAEGFFVYPKVKFSESARKFSELSRNDIFLRDIQTPFDNDKLIDACIAKSAGFKFGDTWRNESATFPNSIDTRWSARAEKAVEFALNGVNLKSAPYQQNLQALSSYAHFDPAQLALEDSAFRDRYFDRNINIAIGFTYDMLIYSYTIKGWSHPTNLIMLQHEFIWFST